MAVGSSIIILDFCIPGVRLLCGKILIRLIRPALAGCVVQELNQVAVGIQTIFLCGLNQAIDHSAGLGSGRGVGKLQPAAFQSAVRVSCFFGKTYLSQLPHGLVAHS